MPLPTKEKHSRPRYAIININLEVRRPEGPMATFNINLEVRRPEGPRATFDGKP